MSSPFRFVAALLLLLGASAAPAADAVDLRWQFKKGQVFKYLLKHREVRTVEVGDQKLETTTHSEYDMAWTVQALDEQTATLKLRFSGLRMTCDGKDFDFQYDSARGNEGGDDYKKKLIRFLDQLRFGEYTLQLRPTGHVGKVEGFDKLQREVGNEGFIVDLHGLALRDASFAWFLQQALGVVPARAAAKGQTWELPAEGKLADFGTLAGRTTYTLVGPARALDTDVQKIGVKGHAALDVDMKWIDNVLRGPLRTSKLEGNVFVDPKAGKVVQGEVRIDLGGDVKLGMGDNAGVLKIQYQHTWTLEARP